MLPRGCTAVATRPGVGCAGLISSLPPRRIEECKNAECCRIVALMYNDIAVVFCVVSVCIVHGAVRDCILPNLDRWTYRETRNASH